MIWHLIENTQAFKLKGNVLLKKKSPCLTMRVSVMEMAPLIFFISISLFFPRWSPWWRAERSKLGLQTCGYWHSQGSARHPSMSRVRPSVCWSFLHPFQHLSFESIPRLRSRMSFFCTYKYIWCCDVIWTYYSGCSSEIYCELVLYK